MTQECAYAAVDKNVGEKGRNEKKEQLTMRQARDGSNIDKERVIF